MSISILRTEVPALIGLGDEGSHVSLPSCRSSSLSSHVCGRDAYVLVIAALAITAPTAQQAAQSTAATTVVYCYDILQY